MGRIIGRLEEPAVLRMIFGWSILATFLLWVAAHFVGWIVSVQFVNEMTMFDTVLALWGVWQGLRVEVRQVEEGEGDGVSS